MGKEIVVTVLGLLSLMGFGVALFGFGVQKDIRKSAGSAGLVAILLAVFMSCYQSVPAGYRGVLLRFGAVHGVLGEGFHLILPFANKVTLMDVRTQKSTAKASAASFDIQKVSSEVSINYHVLSDKVGDVYKRVGLYYEDKVIEPAVQETIKSVIAKFTARQLIQQRETVKAQVDAQLSKRLLEYDIKVEPNGVNLTDFDFSAEFNASIEATQVAQQEAAKQKYILAKTTTEAQTAIMKAKGEAEANRLKAIALERSGGQKVLAREWIEKWDGRLPTVSGSGNSNLIDLRSLMAPDEEKRKQ